MLGKVKELRELLTIITWLQRRLNSSVCTECNPYYHAGMNSKNFSAFP
jgi:hypothetical protein